MLIFSTLRYISEPAIKVRKMAKQAKVSLVGALVLLMMMSVMVLNCNAQGIQNTAYSCL